MGGEVPIIDLIVASVVALAIATIWVLNRRREPDRRIDLPTEVVVFGSLLLVVTVVALYRLGASADDPAAFVAAVGAVAAVVLIAVNMFVSARIRRDIIRVSDRFGERMSGLGNLQFFPSKDDTMKALTDETNSCREKLIATRFSPGDIMIEDDYWKSIRSVAFNPSILYIRIHSLAHRSTSCVEGLCRLVAEMRGSSRFQLGVAMYNNSFELILSDERECIFCFHDLTMTVRNGFKIDGSQPSSGRIVSNFDATLRRMIDDCHIVIDFDRFVKTDEDVRRIQHYLRSLHEGYRQGRFPPAVHASDMEDFVANVVLAPIEEE